MRIMERGKDQSVCDISYNHSSSSTCSRDNVSAGTTASGSPGTSSSPALCSTRLSACSASGAPCGSTECVLCSASAGVGSTNAVQCEGGLKSTSVGGEDSYTGIINLHF